MPRVRVQSAKDEGDSSGGRLRRHTSEPRSGREEEEFEMQEDVRGGSRDRLSTAHSLDIPDDQKVVGGDL